MSGTRILRKVLRLGSSTCAITLPKSIAEKLGHYVWIVIEPDGSVRIERVREVEE